MHRAAARARGATTTAPARGRCSSSARAIDDDDVSRRARRPRPGRRRLRRGLRAGRPCSPGRPSRIPRRRRTRRSARPRATSRVASPARTTSPGNPAISLPCGIAEGNLPAGLQLAAAVGDDELLLSVARDLRGGSAHEGRQDLNWMQLEEYLRGGRPDRAAARLDRAARLPLARGRHDPLRARLGRGRGAARRAGACRRCRTGSRRTSPPIPGSPTLQRRDLPGGRARPARLAARPGLPALPARQRPRRQRPRRRDAATAWQPEHARTRRSLWHNWWNGPRTWAVVQSIDRDASHASWLENFPWTRLAGVAQPEERKPMADISTMRESDPADVRELLGDGSLGGLYERPDDDVLRVWQAGVEEVRELIENGWPRCLTSRAGRRSSPERRTGSARRSRRRSSSTAPRFTGSTRTPSTSPTASRSRRSSSGSARVDILVNNAGGVVGQVGRPLEEVSDDDWRAVVDANLTSTFVCTRAVVPGMKAAGYGRIVNISSGAGRSVSLTGIQAYASAKAGQIGFTRQTAHELGPLRDHREQHRARLRALEPDEHRASGRATARTASARSSRRSRPAGSASPRTSRTASSSSSPRKPRG